MKLLKKQSIKAQQRTYTDQQGAEKKVYRQIGELITFQDEQTGNTFQKVELYTMPGANISVFEMEQQAPQQQSPQQQAPNQEDIQVDIPF